MSSWRPLSWIGLAALAWGVGCSASVAAQSFSGVSLAGAEFGEDSLPGSYDVDYTYPTFEEVDYYLGKGVGTFRIPFRWERLQRTLYGPLDTAELVRLEEFVGYATSQGAKVILDPHNYARYRDDPIGSAAVPHSAFADFWSRLAERYEDDPRVIFGLMNEPHGMPTQQWLDAANAAIAAIRQAGASNLILVPGNCYSGAHSWASACGGSSNASTMQGVVDPIGHFAFEVHQYLDADSSGTSAQIVHETIGSQRLVGFTDWLRDHGHQALLGEFGVAAQAIGDAPSQIGDEAIHDVLGFLDSNADVWLGWSWWAGGPWWPSDYMFQLDPQNLGQPGETDRPQMAVLEPYLLPEPSWALGPGAAAVTLLARLRRKGATRDGRSIRAGFRFRARSGLRESPTWSGPPRCGCRACA